MSEVSMYPAYGGPDGGNLVQVRTGRRTHLSDPDDSRAYSITQDASAPQTTRFRYRLVASADGGNALVPEDDNELRRAFFSASGEPGDRETETLSVEIQRRGLEI